MPMLTTFVASHHIMHWKGREEVYAHTCGLSSASVCLRAILLCERVHVCVDHVYADSCTCVCLFVLVWLWIVALVAASVFVAKSQSLLSAALTLLIRASLMSFFAAAVLLRLNPILKRFSSFFSTEAWNASYIQDLYLERRDGRKKKKLDELKCRTHDLTLTSRTPQPLRRTRKSMIPREYSRYLSQIF